MEIFSFRIRNYFHYDFRGQTNEIDIVHPPVAEGNKIACCDCRSEYLFQHGRETLFPVNSVTGIQDNNLGLISWLAEFVNISHM